MAKRYELSDSEWERISDFFPVSKTGRPPKWDNRTMFNAILWGKALSAAGNNRKIYGEFP